MKKHYRLDCGAVTLVPYHRHFVPQYHGWFVKDPVLLELTGTEPFSLEQEYANQLSWAQSSWRHTFILVDLASGKAIGDVNIFLSEWIEPNQAEVNVMIANTEFRGRGYAKRVVSAIEAYTRGIFGRDTIIAKIKSDNIASIGLFQKLGYHLVAENAQFKEHQYRKYIQWTQEEAIKQLETELGLTVEQLE